MADDGKAVRFFVINRYPDKLRFGVVFDACLLCGDQGYVMEGNQVICVACGVHIFIPSIGKAVAVTRCRLKTGTMMKKSW